MHSRLSVGLAALDSLLRGRNEVIARRSALQPVHLRDPGLWAVAPENQHQKLKLVGADRDPPATSKRDYLRVTNA